MSFVHLHLHSEYSLLDGACRIREIPKAAKAAGHSSVALTDHGVMYGVVEFYRACKEEGIQPIIGCEVYVAPRTMQDKQHGLDSDNHHLVLLVKNEEGYHNLSRLVSQAFLDGFYSKPRCDLELLRKYSGGLIALSACLGGQIPQYLIRDDYDSARDYARTLSDIFGPDNFYLELQDHGIEEQKKVNAGLVRIAEETGIGLVATNDVHYLRAEDADNQAVLMAIQMNTTIADGRPLGFETDEFYYKSTEEMERLFAQYPDALANTQRIAEKCCFDFVFDKLYLPRFTTPDGTTPQAFLKKLAFDGLEARVKSGDITFTAENNEDEYRSRANYELFIIDRMGYNEYFLIVWDFVHHAKEQGIPVGPGRGSGAGSLIAYLIGITDVDSLRYHLLFERFLNPERVSMPDFDIDFCYERRDEVIRYVAQRYGSDHVTQIITFGTMAARAAIRDVGRALGIAYSEVDRVAKAVPQRLGITLQEAMEEPEFRDIYEASEQSRRLIDISMALEGMPRHASTHAAGVVITDQPVTNYVPLAQSTGTVVTQYDMDTIASLGLLKFDFLALRYLTIIDDTVKLIQSTEPTFSLKNIPEDDYETYEMLGQGRSEGVFQLESAGMKQLLTSFRPESIEDIMVAIALFRPGPMDSIPKYLENRKNRDTITYEIPALADILDETCGCIVYQEQVMRIFRIIAGFSYGKADIIRRAMSKKKAGEMEKEYDNFLAGAVRNRVDKEAAARLFDEMASFAKYAFNKSHAAAYAITAYRSAYLKCHYPSQYLASLLTSVLGNLPKMSEYIAEANRRQIRVLPPDVNESGMKFTVSGRDIRFGLPAVKNVGENFVHAILTQRKVNPFRSFHDFVTRMAGPELNKRAVEAMIKAGAFDTLEPNRGKLLYSYEALVDHATKSERDNIKGQVSFFDDGEITTEKDEHIPDLSLRERIAMEKDSAGFCFSGHLIDDYQNHLSSIKTVPINEILLATGHPDSPYRDKQMLSIAGVIIGKVIKPTKNGENMAFITVEDRYGAMELLIFPKVLEEVYSILSIDTAVAAYGELTMREEEDPKLLVRRMIPLKNNREYTAHDRIPPQKRATPSAEQKLYLRVEQMNGRLFNRIVALLEIFEGKTPIIFYDSARKQYVKMRGGVNTQSVVLDEIAALIGRENVVLK